MNHRWPRLSRIVSTVTRTRRGDSGERSGSYPGLGDRGSSGGVKFLPETLEKLGNISPYPRSILYLVISTSVCGRTDRVEGLTCSINGGNPRIHFGSSANSSQTDQDRNGSVWTDKGCPARQSLPGLTGEGRHPQQRIWATPPSQIQLGSPRKAGDTMSKSVGAHLRFVNWINASTPDK